MPISRYVEGAGVELHLLDSGPVAGAEHLAPLVFVPGMSDLATDYLNVIGSFGRRAVVLDRRGHGLSSAPESGYSAADHAADIGLVVDSLTTGPVHIMTFSRGSCYALYWAVRHAPRVASISIGDYPARELQLPSSNTEPFLMGRWRGTTVLERLDRRAAEATFAAAENREYYDELEAMAVPLLVVRSTSPGPMNDKDWERYGAMSHCRRVMFDDMGHDIFRGDRHRYPNLVREHIDATGI